MGKYSWISIIVLILTGCSPVGPHTPVLDIRSDQVSIFPINGRVSIDNAQPDGIPLDLEFRGILVNLNECTQVLVDALSQELRSRGAVVRADGNKHLNVSVTRIGMVSGFNVYRANIDINVTLGSVNTFNIHATRASVLSGHNYTLNPTKPLDVALSDAVMQILGHPAVQQYLAEQKL